MSKLKLEHGVSRVRRTKLQSSIDQSIADDIERLAEWSNNETNYVINQLLRFALAEEEDFQRYKMSAEANTARATNSARPTPANMKSISVAPGKPETSATAHAE